MPRSKVLLLFEYKPMGAKTKQKLRLLSLSFQASFINLWRNKLLSAASIIVIGIIVFIFNIILSIDFTVQNTLQELNKKVDLTIYLQDKVSEDPLMVEAFIDSVKDINGVVSVQFTSKDDALKQIEKLHPQTVEFFQKYQIQNPLPGSISITTKGPEYQDEIKNYIRVVFPNFISSINDNNDEQAQRTQKILENLKSVQNFADQTIFWVFFVFLIGGILIVINSINITIFSRKQELFIQRFIGAKHSFIRLPYILEAVWYAVLAVLFSFFMLMLITQFGNDTNSFALWRFNNIQAYEILLLELFAAVALSTIASFIVIESHLRKKLL